MREYVQRLEGISAERARELMWVTRQYGQYRRRAGAMGLGGGAGRPADYCARRARAIEESARAADAVLWRDILRNVAEGVPFNSLGVPCGKNQFGRLKRIYYSELDRRI